MKTCRKCATPKDESSFHRGRNDCKDCRRAYNTANAAHIRTQKQGYYRENKEHILTTCAKYAKNNPDKRKKTAREYRKANKTRIADYHSKLYKENKGQHREKARKYYIENKENVDAKNRRWRKANPERAAELSREWASRNPDRARENVRRWEIENKEWIGERRRAQRRNRRENDPAYKLVCGLRASLHSALRKGHKRFSAMALLGCDIEELRAWLEASFQPGMTWENWSNGPGNWNIDHIRPIASFDLSREADQKACFHYTNMQPLWWVENMQKKDRLDWKKAA